MIWRNLVAADIQAALRLTQIAGWNQTESDWKGYLLFDPAGCFAVEIDGMLAGTATAIRYGTSLGWIGMVLVHPDHRRQGLAKVLLDRAISYLRGRGVNSIGLDATPMGRTVYLPLGFKDQSEVIRLERGESVNAGWRASASVVGFSSLPLDSIASLDAAAFGVPRPEILSELSRRNPTMCFALPGGGRTEGYLIARSGREAVQLGPWAARSPKTAEELLFALLKTSSGKRVFVDAPSSNQASVELLMRSGFTRQRGFVRMFLDGAPPMAQADCLYGTSGAEKG